MSARCWVACLTLIFASLDQAQAAAVASPTAAAAPRVALHTSMGEIVIELAPDKAPKTVANFLGYVREGFYNGTIVHRVRSEEHTSELQSLMRISYAVFCLKKKKKKENNKE